MPAVVSYSPPLLCRAQRNLIDMLEVRGYHVDNLRAQELSESDIAKGLADSKGEDLLFMSMQAIHKEDASTKAAVFFLYDNLCESIRSLSKYVTQNAVTSIIIVVEWARLHNTEAALGSAKAEVFEFTEVLANPLKYHLVPRHEVLTDGEKASVLRQLKVTEAQLARISVSDPVARWMGIAAGRLVRIYREHPTAGVHLAYRLCV